MSAARTNHAWTIWLAAAAFVAAWSGPLVHQVAEPHQWCAIHGADEHGAGDADRSETGRSILTPAGDDQSHGDLCEILAFGSPPTTQPLDAPAGFEYAHATTSVALTEQAARRVIALLREAPKTSPPGES